VQGFPQQSSNFSPLLKIKKSKDQKPKNPKTQKPKNPKTQNPRVKGPKPKG